MRHHGGLPNLGRRAQGERKPGTITYAQQDDHGEGLGVVGDVHIPVVLFHGTGDVF